MTKQIIKNEGVISLYRSLPITMLMNIPQSALFMTFYENLKSTFFADGNVSIIGYCTCAGVAGSISAGITTPFDMIKTRLQTQHEESTLMKSKYSDNPNTYKSHKYVSVYETYKYILEHEGYLGFYKGLGPRMMIFLPGAAISWSSYEYIKKLLE